VYAGFSNGGVSAEYLAATRASASGCILFSAALPLAMFGQLEGVTAPSWPRAVPVQVHYMTDDPFREQEELDGFEQDVRGAGAAFRLYEYPGNGHLFTDSSLPAEYDEASAELLWQRVAAFLADR
jgi:dienelactone hydrolase